MDFINLPTSWFVARWSGQCDSRREFVYACTQQETVVTPGYKTELGMNDEEIDAFKAHAASITPRGRTGTRDETAKAVSFFSSDDASYITGVELFVDGGQAQNPVGSSVCLLIRLMASTLLIRRAQASFGTESYDRLSELGLQQARIAGEYLEASAGVAAGGVGQDGVALRRQHFEQVRLAGLLADIGAANGDSDDLGRRWSDRAARLVQVLVLAGADQQA